MLPGFFFQSREAFLFSVHRNSLTLMDSFRGASCCAGATFRASLGIDVIDVTFRDSAHRAFVNTSTACNAVFANYISHFNLLFILVSMNCGGKNRAFRRTFPHLFCLK